MECGLGLLASSSHGTVNGCKEMDRQENITKYPRIPSEYNDDQASDQPIGKCAPACRFNSIEAYDYDAVNCDPSEYCGQNETGGWLAGAEIFDKVSFCQTPEPLGASCREVNWDIESSTPAPTYSGANAWGELLTGICAGSKDQLLGWNASNWDADGNRQEDEWDGMMMLYRNTGTTPTAMVACMQALPPVLQNVTVQEAGPCVTRRRRGYVARRRTESMCSAQYEMQAVRPKTCTSFKQEGEACEGYPVGTIDDKLYHAQCPIGHCSNTTGLCTVPKVCDWDYECGLWKNCPAADQQLGIQGICMQECQSDYYCLGSAYADQQAGMKCLHGSCLPVVYATMTQELTISSLTASDFNGWTKLAYQIAYGIAIGIYDTDAGAFKPDCDVTAAVSRRSGITMIFTASLSEAEVSNAQTAAQSMTPADMVPAIDSAKAALGSDASSVVTPAASDMTIASAPVMDYEDSNNDPDAGIDSSDTSTDDSESLTDKLIGFGPYIGGFFVLLVCCACVGGAVTFFMQQQKKKKLLAQAAAAKAAAAAHDAEAPPAKPLEGKPDEEGPPSEAPSAEEAAPTPSESTSTADIPASGSLKGQVPPGSEGSEVPHEAVPQSAVQRMCC